MSTLDIPQDTFFPCRIDLALPGTFHRLLPIPLARVYNTQDRRLVEDCFDILNYTVQLLLDMASHLSPMERERLGKTACIYVHPESGLLIHTSKSFANFAFECILTEHNSTDPLILSPSWPSVFFDENGYPSFCDMAEDQPLQPTPTDKSLEGENRALGAPPSAARVHQTTGQQAPAIIPDTCQQNKRRHQSLEGEPDEYSTLTLPRL